MRQTFRRILLAITTLLWIAGCQAPMTRSEEADSGAADAATADAGRIDAGMSDAGQCGGMAEPCCNGTACNAGLVCGSGVCETECGGPGESCCNGTACNAGLICTAGACNEVPPLDAGANDGGSFDGGSQDSGGPAIPDGGGQDSGGPAMADGGADSGSIDSGGPCSINNGGCSATALCDSTTGSVACECPAGYISNGQFGAELSCTSPCASGNGGCDSSATCSLVDGDVACQCNQGYVSGGQSGTALTCTDPCLVQNGNCSATALCHFADGAVACGCPPGYISNGQFGGALVCTNPCDINNGGCGPDATCALVGETIACSGATGTDGGAAPDAGAIDAGSADAGPTWSDVTPLPSAPNPEFRTDAAMMLDADRAVTVLFGGFCSLYCSDGPSALADTWEWDGHTWMQRMPAASPPPRYGAALAYDSTRHVGVLFGGCTFAPNQQPPCTPLADTWEWDGVTWTQRAPATSPPARLRHRMAFDSGRGVVVLFGGCTSGDSCNQISGDTWEWDGQNWTQASPVTSPAPRMQHGLAYDSQHGVTVLFGGCQPEMGYCVVPNDLMNDTWTWDGTTWTQRPLQANVPRRHDFGMDFDSIRGLLVVFGGRSDSGSGMSFSSNDTWTWDGAVWTQLQLSLSPTVRTETIMVYDSARAESVMFGENNLNDTWLLPSSSL